MKDSYPYVSGSGNLVKTLSQLKKSFPQVVNSATLKKLAIAPNNETYVINTLRFLGLLDEKGQRTPVAQEIFTKHDDIEFNSAFSKLIESAYAELFTLYGEDTWELTSDKLIAFFRSSDKTSDVIGQRQSSAFQTLVGVAGKIKHQDTTFSNASVGAKRKVEVSKGSKSKTKPATSSTVKAKDADLINAASSGVGLTVRIEINLPAGGTQETYDQIFKSIRANLLNG